MRSLSTAMTLVLLLACAGGGMAFLAQAPAHATIGTWSELLVPTGVTLALMGVCSASSAALAWLLWRREHKMAAQLLGVFAAIGPILLWQVAGAANVIFDGSSSTFHSSTVVERYSRKSEVFVVLKSWRVPGETLALSTSDVLVSSDLAPGHTVTVEMRSGAFGRPYVLSVGAEGRRPTDS